MALDRREIWSRCRGTGLEPVNSDGFCNCKYSDKLNAVYHMLGKV